MGRIAQALVAVALVFASTNAFADKLKKLEDREKDAYNALRVYMTDDEEKAFLKLKTAAARDQWLHDNGKPKSYWDRWYGADQFVRDQILTGEVRVGWTKEMVLMAWGEPAEQTRLTARQAELSDLYVYRFEVDKEGVGYVWQPGSKVTYKAVDTYRTEVYIDDNRVTELKQKDGWE